MKKELSKKVQDLLSSGTPKQKAALICKDSEVRRGNLPSLLTDGEVKAIYDSFRNDPRGAAAFNKWIKINDNLFEYSRLVYLAYNFYRANAQELLGYIRVWEDYTREADRLNQLLYFMRNEAPKKVEAFKEEVLSFSYKFGKVKLNKEGYFYIDIDGRNGLYSIIQAKAEECEEGLSIFKTYIVVAEEYIQKYKAEPVIPEAYKDVVPYAKQDIASEIAPAYSRTALLKRKAEGMPISPAEEKRAIFPDYDSTPLQPEIEEVAKTNLTL